jgi:hypothetical protein
MPSMLAFFVLCMDNTMVVVFFFSFVCCRDCCVVKAVTCIDYNNSSVAFPFCCVAVRLLDVIVNEFDNWTFGCLSKDYIILLC